MYETISDLAARNIDTRQLLGLIRDNDSEEKADDKYAYENGSDNSDEVEDGKFLFLLNVSLSYQVCVNFGTIFFDFRI